MRYKK